MSSIDCKVNGYSSLGWVGGTGLFLTPFLSPILFSVHWAAAVVLL